ncbi:MAG: hypothetical protein IJQ72_00230 [Bacilli bacterium]|nr:hypothetical protein [Bacilli bacterium]
MIRKINLGNKKEAIKAFETFKANDYVPFDIELHNSHLKNINDNLDINVFRKGSLYITSKTLWECMQPLGSKGNIIFMAFYQRKYMTLYMTCKTLDASLALAKQEHLL